MIITIQQVNKMIVVGFGSLEVITTSMTDATSIAQGMADTYFQLEGKRVKIKVLPIQHTPMATKKTYPAKKKAVIAKKKIVKGKKK